MENNYLWLTTSLFCKANNWHLVLNEIAQFIDQSNDDILSYQIKFDDDNGDNIRLAILTTNEQYEEIAQRIDRQLTALLSVFAKNEVIGPINNIFLPFPTNTVQFGLYKMGYDEMMVKQYQSNQIVSELMIALLKDDEITKSTILTFAFYLHIALIKAFAIYNYGNAPNFFALILGNEEEKAAIAFTKAITESFTQMHEITMEVMTPTRFEDELQWLDPWMAHCRAAIQEELIDLNNDDIVSKLKKEYGFKSITLHHLLSIDEESGQILTRIIERSLALFETQQPTTV